MLSLISAVPEPVGYVLGILAAILILLVVYAAMMALYATLRKKKAGAKFLPEILMMVIISALNITVKILLLAKNVDFDGVAEEGGHTFTLAYGFTDIFRALYANIGNFTFEGLDGLYATTISKLLQTFYYGTSFLTALVFASVILATANYEFFSWVSVRIRKAYAKLLGRKYDVYVFTALTEETILLAESIKRNEGKEPASGDAGAKACKTERFIVFAGPELESFDRKNELCRRVMANGFYYWSYNESGQDEKEKSIIKTLRLSVRNGLGSMTDKKGRARVVVFSFNSSDHIPQEEQNMDFVFQDIERYIAELHLEKKSAVVLRNICKACFIEYYVLTEREVNYQAYQYKVDQYRASIKKLVTAALYEEWTGKSEGAPKTWAELSEEGKAAFLKAKFDAAAFSRKNALYKFFQEQGLKHKEVIELFSYVSNVGVWNEATAISCSAVEAFQQVLNAYPQDAASFYRKDIRVCSIGYGLTAQTIVKNLYVQTSNIFTEGEGKDTRSVTSGFRVDAYDPSAADIAGLLQYENPLTICLDVAKEESRIPSKKSEEEIKKAVENKVEARIAESWARIRVDIRKTSEAAARKDQIVSKCVSERYSSDDEISPITVSLNEISALDFECVKNLDALTGEDASGKRPQFITIATGDDFHNIKIANALILDILKEDAGEKQIIFVNVWDEKNIDLINHYDAFDDKSSTRCFSVQGAKVFRYSDELTLIIVGSNVEIYSERSVISHQEIANYAVNYSRAYDLDCLEMRLDLSEDATQAEFDRYASKPDPFFEEDVDTNGLTPEAKAAKIAKARSKWENECEAAAARIRKDEAGVPRGVVISLADAVNYVISDVLLGRRIPFSREKCEEIFDLFFDLSVTTKSKTKEENARLAERFGFDLDKETEAVAKYAEHRDFYAWKSWCKAQLWEKESNMSAYMFGYVYKRARAETERLTFDDYMRFANIEHQRWMRVHMCNGWTFSNKKRKARRAHDCILPFYGIALKETYSFDLINVAWGMNKPSLDLSE